MIVATAGHVDHGKTSLIRRLTGVDTDRLPEEKRRGLTIDLGFAYTALPNGAEIGFVDVPGHERFLRNMLAGVLALDSALLVVAADDGPMPQTREHLVILALTGVRQVTGVVTKIDRVPEARAAEVMSEVGTLLARNGFSESSVLAVSSETGAGIDMLTGHLASLSRTRAEPNEGAGFRMAIDRCFALPGPGTVTTGTVAAGRVQVGDLLLITPRGTQVRVRSIRVRDREADAAAPGDRCAMAIAGARLDRAQVGRGDWIVAPALHAPTTRIDALLRLDSDVALRTALPVHAHLGTADANARVTLLSDPREPESGFVRLTFDAPMAALHGDRIVLRDHAARRTLAGGYVIDPFPPARRRTIADRLTLLRALNRPDADAALDALLEAEGCVDLAGFARARNLDPRTLASGRFQAAGHRGAVLLSDGMRAALRAAVLEALGAWHRHHPALAGIGKATLLGRLRGHADAPVLDAVVAEMTASGKLVRESAALRLPTHRARLDAADEALWSEVASLMREAGLRAPRVRELAETLGRTPEDIERALVRFEAFGRLLRVAANRFFAIETIADLCAIASALAAEADEGGFPAAAFAARAAVGRNLSIQILEFLDRIGVTRRVGELRHVVRTLNEALG